MKFCPGGGAPVPQQHVFHIRQRQRTLEQRIVIKINLPHRQIVGGTPVGIDPGEKFRGKSLFLKRLALHRSMLLFFSEVKNTTHHLGYHLFFVRAHHTHRNSAGGCGN